MKMPREVYERLKEDMRVLLKDYYKVTADPQYLTVTQQWHILHEIHAQRSYPDDHPRWKQGYRRALEPSHVGNQGWLAEVYNHGLVDSHIATAMRKAISELSKEFNQQHKPS